MPILTRLFNKTRSNYSGGGPDDPPPQCGVRTPEFGPSPGSPGDCRPAAGQVQAPRCNDRTQKLVQAAAGRVAASSPDAKHSGCPVFRAWGQRPLPSSPGNHRAPARVPTYHIQKASNKPTGNRQLWTEAFRKNGFFSSQAA